MSDSGLAGRGPAATRWVVLAVMYLLTTLLTRPISLGDTVDYAHEIVAHIQGNYNGRWDPLWEFGHVLWRPMGLSAFSMLRPFYPSSEPDFLVAARGLICISQAAGLGCVLLLDSWLLRLTGAKMVSFAVVTGVLFSNAFLNYMGTGNAYVSGLFFLILGHWLIWRGLRDGAADRKWGWLAGLSLGVAVLIWVPYVLVAGAAVLAPLVWRRQGTGPTTPARMGQVVRMCVSMGLMVATGYGVAFWFVGVHSPATAKEWITNAAHGWSQNRNGLRLVFGIPRGFIEMQDQGRLIKRYLFHDQYAPTSLTDIVPGLGVVILFYCTMGAMLFPLRKQGGGRQLLFLLLLGALPVIFFAVYVFEPGSPERYMPIYPLLAAAVAVSLAEAPRSRVPFYAGLLLLTMMMTANIRAMSVIRASQRQATQQERISAVRERVRGGVVAIMTNRDELMAFSKTYPFHPMNTPEPVPIYEVLEIGNTRLATWREDFSARAFESWRNGGEVWISQRLLAERPAPEWQWVEGDDPRIQWKQVPEFFAGLEYAGRLGGTDGFVLLKDSTGNRLTLEALAGKRAKI